MSPSRLLGRARWRYLRHPGTDEAAVYAVDEGFRLAGKARLRFPEGPTEVRYDMLTDPDWRSRSGHIELHLGRQRRSLRIEIDEDGHWDIDGFRRREFRGHTDIDLSASPSTNTLAVNRLHLPVGGRAEIQAGWILFPDLEIRAVRQRYERLSERRYRYEGLVNGFVAEFGVDENNLVTDYPDFWERLPAPGRGGAAAGARPPSRRA